MAAPPLLLNSMQDIMAILVVLLKSNAEPQCYWRVVEDKEDIEDF
jgi:hypothetical protein